MTTNIIKLLFRSRKSLLTSINYIDQFGLYRKSFHVSNLSFHNKPFDEEQNECEVQQNKIKIPNDEKYKIFTDEDSEIIFDVTEEIQRLDIENQVKDQIFVDHYRGINMNRGKTGVFDIEDLVELLKRDNARNIFVAKVPQEYAYVDYIVVTTARSVKHMNAIMHFVKKAYKIKRFEHDRIPILEGKTSTDWQAIDLGNIALHVFTGDARYKFDLETLWAVGPKYDDLTNNKEILETVESYNEFLKELEPAEN